MSLHYCFSEHARKSITDFYILCRSGNENRPTKRNVNTSSKRVSNLALPFQVTLQRPRYAGLCIPSSTTICRMPKVLVQLIMHSLLILSNSHHKTRTICKPTLQFRSLRLPHLLQSLRFHLHIPPCEKDNNQTQER